MDLITIKINDVAVEVEKGSTILEAARKVNVNIPTLCHLNLDGFGIVNQVSSCRVCMVEAKGRPTLITACSEKVYDGLEVVTDSIRAITARRMAVELLLSNHPKDCLVCPKNLDCELQKLASDLGVREIRYEGQMMAYKKDTSSQSIVKDANKCVMCRRCETMCNDVQTCHILSAVNRGFDVL